MGKRHAANAKIVRGPTDFGKPHGCGVLPAMPYRLLVERGALVTIGPERVARQRGLRVGADTVTRGGAEFERFQAVAGEIDVVDGLRALIAAIEHARTKRVAAVMRAERDIFRP